VTPARKRGAAKGVTAKRTTTKRVTAKRATTKRVTAKRTTAVMPADVAPPHASPAPTPPHDDALAARRQRKQEKRGRAAARTAHLAWWRGEVDATALGDAMAARLRRDDERAAAAAAARPKRRDARATGRARAKARATTDAARWVPIGPTVVRRGQAEGLPHVAGRIRDLAVAPDGRRAYAASGRGGVWYTEDAGATWHAVGAWADRRAAVGGQRSAYTCGALLVHFGATAAADYVMVGTGEANLSVGIGVLAGTGPAVRRDDRPAWEPPPARVFGTPPVPDPLEGAGVFRLVRDPAATPGASMTVGPPGAVRDRVAAATTRGLFVGVRAVTDGTARWTWSAVALPAATFGANPVLCDAVWVARAGEAGAPAARSGRLFVAVSGVGVAWTDDLGATAAGWRWVRRLNTPIDATPLGRLSLATVDTRLYVLGELMPVPMPPPPATPPTTPTVWRVDAIATTPRLAGVTAPNALALTRPGDAATYPLWTNQGWYDQAIAVEAVNATTDRLWLGAQGFQVPTDSQFGAALFCLDATLGVTPPAPPPPAPPLPAPLVLAPAAGISRAGSPALPAPNTGDGADPAGSVGANVHADVHVIRRVDPVGAAAQVWVGCDGGCFVSTRGGRANTFQARNVGLGVLEAGYVAVHPASSHFAAAGSQDNGCNVRASDMVWEQVAPGDAGGTLIDPHRPHVILTQYTTANWYAVPNANYVDPRQRQASPNPGVTDREDGAARFYSGASAVARTGGSRVAVGTDRVWITDSLAAPSGTVWLALPFSPGLPATPGPAVGALDVRPGGVESSATFGITPPAPPAPASPAAALVPVGGLGAVVQLRWHGATTLFALHTGGLVRHDDVGGGSWRATLLLPHASATAPNPANGVFRDVAPVPGTVADCYLVGVGDWTTLPGTPLDTCWHYDATADAWRATGLRRQLDETPIGSPTVLGPRDPAHAVVVQPEAPRAVFVGTVAGVWRGTRTTPTTWAWAPFVNGLPDLAVEDLAIWPPYTEVAGTPPAAPAGPRLLRAALGSRGVWEVDLTAGASEAPRTWIRLHARDDRRVLPVPLADPRRAVGSTEFVTFASPDIVVRPAQVRDGETPPVWTRAPGATIGAGDSGTFHLWTFQTAFRWHYPSVRADGLWRDELGDLIEQHRATIGLAPAAGVSPRAIDSALWARVVGATRLTAAGLPTGTAAARDPFAVFAAPWQSALARDTIASEVDLLECVQPMRVRGQIWDVRRGPSVVEVLVHHRDMRALAPRHAYAALYWRHATSLQALLDLPAAPFAPLHAWPGVPPVPSGTYVDPAAPPAAPVLPAPPIVAGWRRVGTDAARLPVSLDALLPRAIPFEIDFSQVIDGVTVPHGAYVALVAIVGGSAEQPPPPVDITPTSTVRQLVRRWPRAALRIVRVRSR
jgi:hypothetical protein